jgi:hypothetical protein
MSPGHNDGSMLIPVTRKRISPKVRTASPTNAHVTAARWSSRESMLGVLPDVP